MSHDPADFDRAANPASSEEEEVVAYLDGELDDEAASHLESRLAADPKLRQQVVQLEQTWEALDELGRSEVDDTFTQTTLEMVAVAAEEELEQQVKEAPRQHRRRWLITAGGLLAAAAAGFLSVAVLRPNPNRQLLEDLPLIERLDQYRQIEDLDFLLKLHEADKEEGGTLFPEIEDDD